MPAILQIELPAETFAQLEQVARQQQRSVDDLVRAMILHELPALPSLPEDIETELAAFDQLSDDVLWLLANTTLPMSQQEELASLNEAYQQRDLAPVESARQQALLEACHRVVIRRAHAAAILKGRGNKSLIQTEITEDALRILYRELGVVNTVRFLNQFMIGLEDYTQERSERLGDETVEELATAIENQRRNQG